MIKRSVKTKKSKQGAILIVVVLILALAMIFIASALILTQATRNRLYGNAMSSQARITVTAASEVFLEALEMQEITDKQLDDFLGDHGVGSNPDNSHTVENKIRMLVSGIPGMADDDHNCTYLDLYYPNVNGVNHADADKKDLIYADFTTIIGDEVENVRLSLVPEQSGPINRGGRFMNQIDVFASVGKTQLRFTQGEGMANPSLNPDDNTVLVRNGAWETTSECVFYSDIVFSGGQALFGGGNDYHGNMVFLDGAYLGSRSSVHKFDGDLYFIGKTHNDHGFVNNNADLWNNDFNPGSVVFSGRKVFDDGDADGNGKVQALLTGNGNQSGGTDSKNKCYFVDSTGTTLSDATVTVKTTWSSSGFSVNNQTATEAIKSKTQLYQAYDYTSSDGNVFPADVVTDVFKDLNTDGKTETKSAGTKLARDEYEQVIDADGNVHTTFWAAGSIVDHDITVVKNPLTKKPDPSSIPTNNKMSIKTLYNKCSNGFWDCPAGFYEFTAANVTDGTTTTTKSSSGPNVICIDGSKASEYRFYFAEGNYYIHDLVFAVYNVTDNTAPVLFILEPGAELYFNEDAQYRGDDNESVLARCGFISLDRSSYTDATGNIVSTPAGSFTNAHSIADYIRTKARGSVNNQSVTTAGYEEIAWSTNHKTTGDKQIYYSKYYDGVKKPCIYIYGTCDNVFKVGNTMTLEAYVGLYDGSSWEQSSSLDGKVIIYGRVEAETIMNGDNPTGLFQMPYCPAPGSLDPEEEEFVEAKTKYQVANIIYYYQ